MGSWVLDVPEGRRGVVRGAAGDVRPAAAERAGRTPSFRALVHPDDLADDRAPRSAEGMRDRAAVHLHPPDARRRRRSSGSSSATARCSPTPPGVPIAGAGHRPRRHRGAPGPHRAGLPGRARPADRHREPAADHRAAGRVRGAAPAGRDPAADRHRPLQGRQRPARARGGRPGDPARRRDGVRAARGRARCWAGWAATSSRWCCRAATPRRGLALGEQLCDAVAGDPIVDGRLGAARDGQRRRGRRAAGDDVEVGLAQADLALYEAKNAGRNRARLFAPDQYRQAVARVGAAAAGRRRARRRRRCSSTRSRSSTWPPAAPAARELLIRLRDGLDPPLGPADFLPAAERTDLVLRLDRWVLGAGGAARWPRRAARGRGLRLEVNISARSLEDDDLGDWVLAELAGARRRARPARAGDHRDRPRSPTWTRPSALVGRLTDGRLRLLPRRLRRRVRLVLPPQAPAVHRGEDRR